jgi:hypothetical protein
VPFSVFPSSYREASEQTNNNNTTNTTTTKTHEELKLQLPQHAGREGQYSSYQAHADRPVRQEEVRITREEERYRRPGDQHEKKFFFERR